MIEIPKAAQSIEHMGQCFHSNQPLCYKNRNKLSNELCNIQFKSSRIEVFYPWKPLKNAR